MLVFANKQDLPNALSVTELTEKLGLNTLRRKVLLNLMNTNGRFKRELLIAYLQTVYSNFLNHELSEVKKLTHFISGMSKQPAPPRAPVYTRVSTGYLPSWRNSVTTWKETTTKHLYNPSLISVSNRVLCLISPVPIKKTFHLYKKRTYYLVQQKNYKPIRKRSFLYSFVFSLFFSNLLFPTFQPLVFSERVQFTTKNRTGQV